MKKIDCTKETVTFEVKGFGKVRCFPVGTKIGDGVATEPLLYAEDLAPMLGFRTVRKAMGKMGWRSKCVTPGGWSVLHIDMETGKDTTLHLVDEVGLRDMVNRAPIDKMKAYELYAIIVMYLLPQARGEAVVHNHLFTPREKAEARVYFENQRKEE